MSAQLGEGPEALSKTGGGRALVQTTEFRLFLLSGVNQSQKMDQQKLALGLPAQISATSPGSRTRRFWAAANTSWR
jgi:hypothetical protein